MSNQSSVVYIVKKEFRKLDRLEDIVEHESGRMRIGKPDFTTIEDEVLTIQIETDFWGRAVAET